MGDTSSVLSMRSISSVIYGYSTNKSALESWKGTHMSLWHTLGTAFCDYGVPDISIHRVFVHLPRVLRQSNWRWMTASPAAAFASVRSVSREIPWAYHQERQTQSVNVPQDQWSRQTRNGLAKYTSDTDTALYMHTCAHCYCMYRSRDTTHTLCNSHVHMCTSLCFT